MRPEQAPVYLEEYNDEWPAMFVAEKALLMCTISEHVAGGIEHIGSTSVAGLLAKPVIDVMVGVSSLKASREAINKLRDAGYQYSAYKGDVMHWFCKPFFAYRTHHLHLVPYESSLWFERICFRDYLRDNPSVASEYVELKKRLAQRYERDREAYTEEKWPFVESVLKRSRNPK